jgi:hypothetical protein
MRNRYPTNWDDIAKAIKDAAGWRCSRCGDPHSYPGHILTVHHIDGDPANCDRRNLVALCQSCHLHVQGWGVPAWSATAEGSRYVVGENPYRFVLRQTRVVGACGHIVKSIEGIDARSQKYIRAYRFWCPRCEAATVAGMMVDHWQERAADGRDLPLSVPLSLVVGQIPLFEIRLFSVDGWPASELVACDT